MCYVDCDRGEYWFGGEGRRGMTDTGATLLAAFIGGIIGGGRTFAATFFGLKRRADAALQLAQQQHEWEVQGQEQARTEQRRNVRTLLWLEIDQNIEVLSDFWKKVTTFTPPRFPVGYGEEER